jgi:hypothetical protein
VCVYELHTISVASCTFSSNLSTSLGVAM